MSRNSCDTCRHKQAWEGKEGHCYMFRTEPTLTCMQHPERGQAPLFKPTKQNEEQGFGRYLVLTAFAGLMIKQHDKLKGLK